MSTWRIYSITDKSEPYRRVGLGPILAPLGRYAVELDSVEPEGTARVAALIAAAPEMESLLRELFPYFDPLPDDIDPGLGLLLTKMLMMVKRIDAAKAGE